QGQVVGNPYNHAPTPGAPDQANVVLGGTIYGEGFDGGGTFTLKVPTVTIDGSATDVTYPAGTSGVILLPTSFFSSGFSQYSLTSTYGSTTVTAGTQVLLRGSSFLPTAADAPTGAIVRDFAPVGFLPDGLRKPVSLSLAAAAGNVLIDRGAGIIADPQATISLNGGLKTVLGSIIAPAGTINLGVGDAGAVWLGPEAVLDVSGTFLPNPRVVGYSTGTVLDAGAINLSAGVGNIAGTIVVQPGAELDLQGAEVPASSNLIQMPN